MGRTAAATYCAQEARPTLDGVILMRIPPPEPIKTKAELAAAAVQAFLDGDAATSQHIVDELGARAKPKGSVANADGLDWS